MSEYKDMSRDEIEERLQTLEDLVPSLLNQIETLEEGIEKIESVAHNAVEFVSSANYPERVKKAHDEIDKIVSNIMNGTE